MTLGMRIMYISDRVGLWVPRTSEPVSWSASGSPHVSLPVSCPVTFEIDSLIQDTGKLQLTSVIDLAPVGPLARGTLDYIVLIHIEDCLGDHACAAMSFFIQMGNY